MQLTLFNLDPELYAAFYIVLYDESGLLIKMKGNYTRYATDDETERRKVLSAVKKRFDQLTSSGIVSWGEILSTETRLAEHQWGDKNLVTKHYPSSAINL